jgi:hypothetical protein
MCFFLLLELFLELGVGLLKIMDVVLEQPCFSCPLLLQLIELFAKIDVFSDFFLDALILRLELPEATLDCLQLLRFSWEHLATSCIRGKTEKTKQLDKA